MKPLICCIDFGTTNIKISFTNATGKVSLNKTLPVTILNNNTVIDRDIDYNINNLFKNLKLLSKKHPKIFSNTIAIIINSQRATTLFLDKNNNPIGLQS